MRTRKTFVREHQSRGPAVRVTPPGPRAKTDNEYRTLFEKIPVGLYWTSPGGEILDLNPAMAQMLGYAARDEALGKNARDFYLDPHGPGTFHRAPP